MDKTKQKNEKKPVKSRTAWKTKNKVEIKTGCPKIRISEHPDVLTYGYPQIRIVDSHGWNLMMPHTKIQKDRVNIVAANDKNPGKSEKIRNLEDTI